MSSVRLSRSEREYIIGSYLKGKPVSGYDVIECANGKYRVKAQPFEVEEDVAEQEPIIDTAKNGSDEPEQEQIKEEEPVKPKPKQKISKQDARELLKQLTDMFSDDDFEEEPQQRVQKQQRNWNRRRLKF